MFSVSNMNSSGSTMFSAYVSFAASMMLVRSMANELIPHPLRSYLLSAVHFLFSPLSSTLTVVVNEKSGIARNQVYDAAQTYLSSIISPSAERIGVSKTPRQRKLCLSIEKDQSIVDHHRGVRLTWRLISTDSEKNAYSKERRFFEVCFDKRFKEIVMDSYLPYVLERAKAIREEEKVVKLFNRACPFGEEDSGCWGSVNLEHPSTFDTLAMDPDLKKFLIDDLDRFVKRREFYKRVGKVWKRGYLLYGPPGTGKSSLIAAIANYLKFDVYDLELTSIYDNAQLRNVLLSTTNRSILVIEDIDCSKEAHDREDSYPDQQTDTKLTLSGLLNFIDGLWSSCGDERIIVFTTNHKERLDPALLRPGRMDVHINMSYCTVEGFKLLASNYLGGSATNHPSCREIEKLIECTQVTPAEVAEELMKNDTADLALEGFFNFLKRKHAEEGIENDQVPVKKKLKTIGDVRMRNVVGSGRRGGLYMGH